MHSDGRSQAVANRPKAVIWCLQKKGLFTARFGRYLNCR